MRSTFGRRLRVLAAVTAFAAVVLPVAPATAEGAGHRRGPDPTEATLTAKTGPYATAKTVFTGPGFTKAIAYYPKTTREGRFGAVTMIGGFLNNAAQFEFYGPRIASQGFVVAVMEPKSIFEGPTVRADEKLALLDHLVKRSPVRDRVDPARLAVMGYSFGGGATLHVAKERPDLKAAVAIEPWEVVSPSTFESNTVPQLVISGDLDVVAPTATMGEPYYRGLKNVKNKAFLELKDAHHFTPLDHDDRIFRYSVAWLKRYVDGDTRYDRFFCPATGNSIAGVKHYEAVCPAG
ncbi:dienelactone hydrolase family protein [Actinocorallia sp. API 0066]|uniref:poly(ethylene terephthalate) hydrolase family protein n=1 Tax=Actinocorallia sp. API 0066 TaxID=2896846 RepID=UPI001E34651F|nr:dienelactone hydrolase family protein [Actinocorallia sp. API 0066]MCD0448525.1 dienelactone hydrolase family protein [Actinocorallia sp. API 0066]